MRSIWNAGAALAVTGLLTITASLVSGSNYAAQAQPPFAQGGLEQGLEVISDGPHRHYTGLAEHFRAANTSNDGKLTLTQARQAGWSRVIRHFGEIDSSRAGYVTLAQIHAFNLAHRHARRTV
ncbi:hypothetical protein [Lichenicoccus sp.]|uniref:hypothetical protein n=1 Tax=Lichenicoccus sp. TaxID=2781899 RepID=UPI003D0EA4F5